MSNLPPNWKWVKLGDVIDKISTTGIKLKQKEYLSEGKYPVIDQGQELIGGFSNDKNLVVDCELPVIIFSDHTKVKKFIDFKFIAGADGAKVIKPHKVWNPKLFYYFLHCIKFPDKGYARHFQFVEKANIPLPPLPEQKKIVEKIEELFSQLDSGVAALKKAKEQIRMYRQSVLAAAFSGRLIFNKTNVGTGRDLSLQETSSSEILQNKSGLGSLPAGWKWVKLGEVSEIIMGQSPPSSTYNIEQIGLPFFQGKAEFTDLYPKVKKWCSEPKKVAEPRDILISVRAPVGATNIANQKCCIGRGLAVVRYTKCNKYVFYYFRLIEKKLDELGTGSTFKAISSKTLNNLQLPLPSLDEQKKIVEEIEKRFSEADNLEKAIDVSLAKAESLRQSILKQAFEGKLV